jgi:putative flippase GtrA
MASPSPRPVRSRLAGLSPSLIQLVRFGLVGGLGTLTNLLLFFALVDRGGLAPLLGAVACFAVAVSQNYVLNEFWTFATAGGANLSWSRYAKFVAASLVGLAVNAFVLAVLVRIHAFPLLVIPQAIGIAAGTAVNFLASRYFVFARAT